MNVREHYLILRNAIDERCDRLFQRFSASVNCRRGCSRCCTHLAVLPVEFDQLRRIPGISALGERNQRDNPNRCPFLKDNACAIYAERPLICRVFGLPQLWRIEEWGGDGRLLPQTSWESALDWCELNFTSYDPEDDRDSFKDDELIDMYALNQELLRLNTLFCSAPEGKLFDPHHRIPLGELL